MTQAKKKAINKKSKKKKFDRPALASGVRRVLLQCKVDPDVLKKAGPACTKKYGLSLSSKVEDFIKADFPELFSGQS